MTDRLKGETSYAYVKRMRREREEPGMKGIPVPEDLKFSYRRAARRDWDRNNDFGRNAFPMSPGDQSGGAKGMFFLALFVPSAILAYHINEEQSTTMTLLLALLIVLAVFALFSLGRRR